MRVATVIGTRPEIIKMAPLIGVLDREFEHRFIFSNQHYSPNMVSVFLDELDVRQPDVFLSVNSSSRDALAEAIGKDLADFAPDLVLVYGDTNSTVAAARGKPEKAKLGHIEAGIRSFDLRMPEEHNRIETDRLSDYRFAPTGLARYFLEDIEGYDADSVFVVGNLVVDAWVRHADRIRERPLAEGLKPGSFCLLTMHRAENVDEPKRLKRLLDNFATVGSPIVFPVHPRTRKRMEEFGLAFPENVQAIDPLGYFDFMRLFVDCDVMLTDSGGVQEEAITLGVPCVTLRDNTERMETVFMGANVLFDADHRQDLGNVVADMSAKRDHLAGIRNPFGNGDCASKIMSVLQSKMENE